jgi:hypothetical protein
VLYLLGLGVRREELGFVGQEGEGIEFVRTLEINFATEI